MRTSIEAPCERYLRIGLSMKQLDVIGRLISVLVRLHLFAPFAEHAATEIGGRRRRRGRENHKVTTEEWSSMQHARLKCS